MILMALHTVSVNQSVLTQQQAKQAVHAKLLMKGVVFGREAFIHVYGKESGYSLR
jgi:hypothetical protein